MATYLLYCKTYINSLTYFFLFSQKSISWTFPYNKATNDHAGDSGTSFVIVSKIFYLNSERSLKAIPLRR